MIEKQLGLPPGTLDRAAADVASLSAQAAMQIADTRACIERQLGLRPGALASAAIPVAPLSASQGIQRSEDRAHIERMLGLRAGFLSSGADRWGTATLAGSLDATAGELVQLLPATDFQARDGRPGPGEAYRMNEGNGPSIARGLDAVAKLTPVVVDYDHQTLSSKTPGGLAPAAGWITSASWVPFTGLFARIEWTARAAALIAAREYRHMSAIIQSDAAHVVTGVLMAALVNYPAVLGMQPVLIDG